MKNSVRSEPSALDSTFFEVDKYATELIRGKKSLVHGLAIPCAWSWCDGDPDTEKRYQELVTNILATLFSFKDITPISQEILAQNSRADPLAVVSPQLKRSRIFEVWNEVLTDHLSRPENRPSTGHKGEGAGLHSGTSAVMFLEVSRIEVCKSACVFHFADRYGVLAQLRAVVRAAAEDERLRSAEEELGLPAESLSSHVSIPNIVHSTFARYDHITFSSTDEEDEFRSELLDLCAGWEPRSVGVDSFHLVHEYHPYMQVQKLWRPEKGRVTTSPIIATYRLQDLMELTATTTATTTMVTTEMDTADTSRVEDSSKPSTSPCRDPTDTGEDNELTLTPLSPMYHQYIHPSEERRLRGDAEDSGTPFKLSSDLGDGEMLLTPLSEQLGSAGGSAASAMGAITQGAGDEDDGSHLVRSLADGALFSPTIGSPPPAKGQPRSKVPVVTTVDADADAGHTGKKLPIKGAVPRRTWVSVLGSCVGAGAFVVTVGGAAYWCNTHREEVRKLLQQWATHFTGLFTAFNTKKLT